jgi:DNA-binding NarL/FixJ family response regulator
MKTSSEPNPVRILIVDDHLIVRAGLKMLLENEAGFVVVGGIGSASEALAFLDHQIVDVVLLDLRMPDRNGLEVLPEILAKKNPPRVLILSSFEYEEEIYRAVKAGAHGYLTKDATKVEIIGAIRRIAKGDLYFPKAIAARIAERESHASLSPREGHILIMLAKGLTNKEIARVLQISQFTVRNHVIHVLGKLQASDRTEAVSIAIHQGILGDTI